MTGNTTESKDVRTDFAQRRKWLVLFILLLALAVRTYVIISFPTIPTSDAADYHQLASGLAEGRGYVNNAGEKTAWRPPGYPLFLAGIYRTLGTSVPAATIVQVLLGSLTVLLLIIFGSMIVGWREALVAGAIAAIYPGLFWLPRLLLSENLSVFLMLAALASAAMLLRTNHLSWAFVFGLLCGLSTLVRGANALVAAAVVAGLLFVTWKSASLKWRQLVAVLLLIGGGFFVILVPWATRNYRVFHRFVPIATQEGLALYASYWPPQKGGKLIWGTLPGNEDPAVAAASRAGDEVAVSKYLQSVTFERLREHPGYFFRLIPSKLISMAVPLDWEIFPHAAGTSRSLNLGYLLILLPALVGFLVLMRRPAPHQWLLWVLPAAVFVQAIVFYGSPRFRLPAEMVAILLGAVGIRRVWSFLKSSWDSWDRKLHLS
jgi:4-amino-4-deoxy-L-arabinose transferase-like glycosyltransferase